VVDDAIRAFVEEAGGYCLLIESNESSNSWTFAQACLSRLLRLYDSALHLPELEPETQSLLSGISHEEWESMREHVGRKLARDYYWEIFEPLEEQKPEPVAGSLSDDLADIWRDLKPGLRECNGTVVAIQDIVWQWRFSFETHWGHHAAGAIAALHALCFGQFADVNRPQSAPAGMLNGRSDTE
jgi:hypothetical protein